MPLEIPNLDDRLWTDLVEDGRSLIPQLAPRWTDHNAHDPGITFIELFAWLAEMQIYQLNRVGEKHRETFGRLAGIQRRLRTAARVNVLAVGTLNQAALLPAETQIAPLEGDEIVFETTSDVRLTRTRLERVIVDDGAEPVDQTDANEKSGIAFLAFGEHPTTGTELRLGFDRFYPSDDPTIRLSADVFTADLGGRCGLTVPVEPNAADSTPVRAVDLAWEYLGPGSQWLPLGAVEDETSSFAQSGALTFAVPSDAVLQQGRVWIRGRIVRGSYDIEPRLLHIGVNGFTCVQHHTIRDQLLGRGNGRPDQSFELTTDPILIPASGPAVRIEVGDDAWEMVTSFEASGPSDAHYVFDTDTQRVEFGNGLNGRMPMAGQDVRAAWYQTSTGRSGNVSKGLTWRFKNRVVPGVTIANPQPAAGGADTESLHELELRARSSLTRPQRAVTLSDIEQLALGTPNVYVARAHGIPNCPAPEQITVVAVPKVRPGRTGPPVAPSDVFTRAVRRHLQSRRLLCDNLRVVAPVYVEVVVSARLRLAKGASAEAVIERARQALNRYLAGEDQASLERAPGVGALASPCPTQWPFGRSVFPSEVYAALDRVAGVDFVSALVLSGRRGDAAVATDLAGAIPLPKTGLVLPGAHQLTVETETRRRR